MSETKQKKGISRALQEFMTTQKVIQMRKDPVEEKRKMKDKLVS